MVSGHDLQASANPPEIVINDALAAILGSPEGLQGLTTITLRATCRAAPNAAPAVTFRVAGIARFPFDTVNQLTAGTSRLDLVQACGEDDRDQADLIVVSSAPDRDPDEVRAAIARLDPALTSFTNAQMVGQLDASGFSYFRQISAVLATVTSAFGLLLITVLLTVSVNQRLGTIAAVRAIGFTRRRVIADVMCESALMVGIGGVLAIPLGFLLATWLDRILTRIPGLPGDLHFFVYEPRALLVHAGILVVTALLAAAYPARLVARLPIAMTLRNETIS
jgi:ABC-type lipoprotein release transport system permease subunit